MELRWLDSAKTNIGVVLGPDEILGNIIGPTNISVPTVPGNTEYEILRNNLDAVEPYEEPLLPPPPPTTTELMAEIEALRKEVRSKRKKGGT